MERNDIGELIRKVRNNEASPDEVRHIERLIERGEIDLEAFADLRELDSQVMELPFPAPPQGMDERFHRMLSAEKRAHRTFSLSRFVAGYASVPRLAVAATLLLGGFCIGYLMSPRAGGELTAMREEMRDMKEMMVLSMLERESPVERLKAVNLGAGMDEAGTRVTEALVETLNHDDNVNVRLAALDALKAYAYDSGVREALIRSISKQGSPLVQIALAETMVQIQARSSVEALEQIIKSEKTPDEVKKKIRESIDILI